MTAISEQEVFRYLRLPGKADGELLSQIRKICQKMETTVTPKSVWAKYSVKAEENRVSISGAAWNSTDLAKHLNRCPSLLLFAATLGPQADQIARTEAAKSSIGGAIAFAAGAAMIEQYCDDTQGALAKEFEAQGLYLRPRFSPGYGDFPLAVQRDFFSLLDLPRRLGLSLNDSFLMIPSKSVTAVIGISSEPKKRFQKCIGCGKTDCPFRKEVSA